MEEWRTIKDFPDYQISSEGRVKSFVVSADGRIRKNQITKWNGKDGLSIYESVNLHKDGITKGFYIHRLVLNAFVGECPEGYEACHGDGNPLNNSLENIRWGTRSSNRTDCCRHGRTYSKLSEEEVLYIKKLIPYWGYRSDVSKSFGVSPKTISRIRGNPNYRTWTYLDGFFGGAVMAKKGGGKGTKGGKGGCK